MRTEKLIGGSYFNRSQVFHLTFQKQSEKYCPFPSEQNLSSFYRGNRGAFFGSGYSSDRRSPKIKSYRTSNIPIRWSKVARAKRRIAKKSYFRDEVYQEIAQRLAETLF